MERDTISPKSSDHITGTFSAQHSQYKHTAVVLAAACCPPSMPHTCAVLLGLVHEGLQRLALGAEPEPVVDELGVPGHEVILRGSGGGSSSDEGQWGVISSDGG